MCGRFTRHHKPEEIAERFGAEIIEEALAPRYNIAPSQYVPIIRWQGEREMIVCKWGLVPFWAKEPSIGNKMINARAETLAEKPSFKQALAKRRCLVLADGFYEWPKTGSKKEPSQPVYLRLRGDKLFAFAGLWEEWKSAEGTILRTFTIITVEPNDLVSKYHHRMAAILEPEEEEIWLNTKTTVDDSLQLLKPYSSEKMEAYQVSREVNSPSFDDPSCIVKISPG